MKKDLLNIYYSTNIKHWEYNRRKVELVSFIYEPTKKIIR